MAHMSSEDEPNFRWAFYLHHESLAVRLRPLELISTDESQCHWCLDFEASLVGNATAKNGTDTNDFHTGAKDFGEEHSVFFTDHLFTALAGGSTPEGKITVLRFLYPKVSGYPTRSDFLEYRFMGCEYARHARSFLNPLTSVTAIPVSRSHHVDSEDKFIALISCSIGAIIGQHPRHEERDVTKLSRHLDDALRFRLSVPYLLPSASFRRRIFWVQGRTNIEASRQFYQAAYALGLTLVVVDAPGHWMEDPLGQHAHYREAFIPMSIDGDEGLVQRIVDAVRAYPHPVHGIVTISDVRLPHVAKACKILGLPTESPDAYMVAGDKGETRKLEMGDGGESFVLNTADELDSVLDARNGVLDFPLIVKPCTGWNSDCVVKVRSLEELQAAVRRASDRHRDSAARNTRVVVEPYIDGPEVDADFVVLDGEVLFHHITDDFPCSGDLVEGTMAANFMETLMDIPSALPNDEKITLRDSLIRSIKRCGFRSGVYHCEARVRDSRTHYVPRKDNGMLDLRVREVGSAGKSPSCYLHEINARPPGYANCVVTLLGTGVDHYALRLLFSLGLSESDRIKALAQPFLDGKSQYTTGIAVLPPSRLGIMASDDAIGDFLEANPGLREHVPWYQTIKESGDLVQGPDASELWMVGFVVVVSRKGRAEWLELAQQVREKFDYKVLDQ